MNERQVPIHVVGIGLDGAAGLTEQARSLVEQATLLVGSDRHLSYFPDYTGDHLLLSDLTEAIAQVHRYLSSTPDTRHPIPSIVVLASGDPLFFGLGRLLLAEFPTEQLTFHPHLSSIQLAFSRTKLPWQDARIVSVHGRSLDELIPALQQGVEKIAVLTDGTNTPSAIANLLRSLELPIRYHLWVCENLGAPNERILAVPDATSLSDQVFAPLNVVVLQRLTTSENPLNVKTLPLLGIPDRYFLSFSDRPGLMTKREVRVQVLGELGLSPSQTVWDVGAGTGSVSIEMARLCPSSQIYAIEQTAIGSNLIQQNCERFQVSNVASIHGKAPDALKNLPQPDRVFIGGSGGNLTAILDMCSAALAPNGRMVLALATLEHLTTTLNWVSQRTTDGVDASTTRWSHRLVQLQISRSLPIANLTRFAPLNPVTLVVLERD